MCVLAADKQLARLLLLLLLLGSTQLLLPAVLWGGLLGFQVLHLPVLPCGLATKAAAHSTAGLLPD
jgi:hypothetical protein